MFNRTIMYAKLAWVYAKGICGFRRKVYDLKFVHDDNMWYIDMTTTCGTSICLGQAIDTTSPWLQAPIIC